MSNRKLEQLRNEWRSNQRLRYGTMVIVVILGVQGMFMLSDAVDRRIAAYADDVEMQARLEGMRTEAHWPARAEKTRGMLDAVIGRIPEVSGKGMAQAESQAWLTRLAADQGIVEPRVKVEDTVDVDAYPDMWQVISRLEGTLPDHGQAAFMRALADALPWVQVERIEIAEGAAPRVVVTFRSYYRKAVAGSDSNGFTPSASKEEAPPNPDAADLAR